MRFLRTAPTRRLLAAVTGLVLAIVAGSAIAIAAGAGGPVPARTTLAKAIHHALGGAPVAGITARVTFTNHLIDSGSLQGSDPLLNGSSGRLWLSPGDGLRLELQSPNGTDAQIVVRHGAFWAYDPSSNTVYRGILPTGSDAHRSEHGGIPTVADIRTAIGRLAGKLLLSGAIPGDIAGHAVYTAQLSPADRGSRLDRVAVSWDAANAVPLRLAVYAKGDAAPVFELAASSITYGAVPASTFSLTPPTTAKVVTVTVPGTAGPYRGGHHGRAAEVTGAAAVAKRLGFRLDAPGTAGGRALTAVHLLGAGSRAGALLTYGRGLGSVAVIERPMRGRAQTVAPPRDRGTGLTLPSVTLRGATGQELDTALGSVLTFTRSGVSYTVLGSVAPSAVKAVAGAL